MEFTGSCRHELKYQISPADHHALRQRLRSVMKRDPHTGADRLYTIRNVYFNNYGDKALREKVNGVQKRKKVRIRYYAAEVNKKGAASRSEMQLPFSIQNSRNRSLISSSVSSPRSACSSTCIACATAAFHSSTLIFPRTFLCFSRS